MEQGPIAPGRTSQGLVYKLSAHPIENFMLGRVGAMKKVSAHPKIFFSALPFPLLNFIN